MRMGMILGSALLGLAMLAQAEAGQKKQPAKVSHKHPLLHDAVTALRHAHEELRESKEEFGGLKHKAEKAIDGAIKNIEALLHHEKDQSHTKHMPRHLTTAHKKYTHHPYLQHALHEVGLAHHYLKESRDDFGGHRTKALHEMDLAKHEIEQLLNHGKQPNKTTR